jgi:hypothetical protein
MHNSQAVYRGASTFLALVLPGTQERDSRQGGTSIAGYPSYPTSPLEPSPRHPWRQDLSLSALALSAPALAWWVVGDLSSAAGSDVSYGWGPYSIDVRLEQAVGALAAVAGVVGLVLLAVITVRQPSTRWLWRSAALLSAAGALGAVAWRLGTAGTASSDGADIGGGLAILVMPACVGGLVAAAVFDIQRKRRAESGWPILAVGALTATAYVVLLGGTALGPSGSGRGVISHAAFDQTQIGETSAQIHAQLGRPGGDTYQFFAPVRPAAACDYYTDTDSGFATDATQYQFCYLNDRVVSRKASKNIYGVP